MIPQQEAEEWAWETFAIAYPHEAAEMDWRNFFAFMQKMVPGITEERVREALRTHE